MSIKEHITTTASLFAIISVVVATSYYIFTMNQTLQALSLKNNDLNSKIISLKLDVSILQNAKLDKTNVVSGPKGDSGIPGPTGSRGPAGKAASKKEIVSLVHQELSKFIAKKNIKFDGKAYISQAKSIETFKVSHGSSETFMNDALIVSVFRASTGSCQYRITSSEKQGEMVSYSVGAKRDLAEHGLAGLYLLLIQANAYSYCTFKFI